MKRGHPPAATRVGRRRGGIRQAAAARARRSVESIVQPVNRIPAYALLDPDAEEAIHQASMRILEEIGVDFRGDPEALALWREAGAEIAGERVRIPRELAMTRLATAPDRFTQHARNPERSVVIGGSNLVLAPVYGPPYVRDLDGVRRRGTLEDLENFIKARLAAPGPQPLGRHHLRAAGRARSQAPPRDLSRPRAPLRQAVHGRGDLAGAGDGLRGDGPHRVRRSGCRRAHRADLARQRQLSAGVGTRPCSAP